MSFNEHRFSFAGKKVKEFEGTLFDLDKLGFRIRKDYDGNQSWMELFQKMLEQPNVSELTSLLVGAWDPEDSEASSSEVVATIVAARDQLPNLTALFLGDITYEECEVSWIHQCNVGPLFHAFPKLKYFAVRGTNDLSFGRLEHANLKHLSVQSGGLDVSVVHDIFASDFPALEHLDLYLGTDNYGANTQITDLAPLLRGELFPKLSYLGLRDSDLTDAIAGALANAPILTRIKELDLSLGTLTDEGVRALMTSPHLEKLEKLDIHHHFVNPEVLTELKSHLRKLKVKIDASDPQDPNDEWRFVAIGE
jgi:hypothetical protein